MRKIIIRVLVCILPFGLIAAYKKYSKEQKDRETIVAELVLDGLKYAHYNPNKIDDSFSEKVYKSYIEGLDYTKKFFLQEDIDKLDKYKDLLDDELNQNSLEFLDVSGKIIENRIAEASKYYTPILEKPFNFDMKETIELDDKKNDYAKSKKELISFWRKSLKYQVLIEITSKLEIQKTALEKKDTSVVQKTFAEIEKEAREKVKKRNDDYFHRLSQLEEKDRFGVFINCISLAFDPHTNYYPPNDKTNFDIQMSGQLEGIGATLQEKDDFIKVVQIMPGSPSYKQGELKTGDLILKVAQGDEEPLDITGMRLDKAVTYIRGKKGTTVKLTVKKVDGTIKVIPIVRDVIVIEETYAKSVILTSGDTKKRIGYIYLPSFYVNFNEKNGGRRCSDDVLKEIEKLKNENIDGLIIDLRNNGGGSLPDVVKMAGFFIKSGPIVQVKQKTQPAQVLLDVDPEMYYDGPMAVLVNSGSASASEIFAAALQDYHRAVIIGGQQTFGKGTVQRVINLDEIVSSKIDKYKPLGALTLTFQKFYRISGGSTQIKGVVPDVILPDSYKYIEYGERDLDYHMPWDEIKPADYTPTKAIPNYQLFENKSKARTEENKKFALVDEQAKLIKKYKDETLISLNLKDYQSYLESRETESKRFDSIYSDTNLVNVIPLKVDVEKMQGDTSKIQLSKDWYKRLKSDFYLKESINVIEDISHENI